MDQHGPADLDETAPMVLRKVAPERRHLARAMTAPTVETAEGRWWEWVDAAADVDLPPAAVALTKAEPRRRVAVVALGVRQEAAERACEALLQALLAILRSRSIDTVVMRTTDGWTIRILLAAGFWPDPDVDTRYVVVL